MSAELDHAAAPPAAAVAATSGGRSGSHTAIRQAALELLAEVGYDRMSMDAVAARARASKATIYRHWPGKRELVLEAVRCHAAHQVEAPDTGSLRGDLVAVLRAVADGIGTDAALLAGALRAMRSTPELAECMRSHVVDEPCSQVGRVLVQRAVDRGELPPAADPGAVEEIPPALMFFRVLVCGAPVDDEYLNHIADDVLIPLLIRSGDPNLAKGEKS